MSADIWFREDVSEAEWEAFAQQEEKEAEEFEQRKWQNWQDDFHDFYSGKIAIMKQRRADLARNHGIDSEWGLVEIDNPDKVVDAKMVDGKFGRVWRIKHEDGNIEWVNVSSASTAKKQQAHYAKKGYQLAYIYYHFADGRHGFYALKERGVLDVRIIEQFGHEMEIEYV
jgi:hypothetical protein